MMLVDSRKMAMWINILSIVFGLLLILFAIFSYEDFNAFLMVMISLGILFVNIYPILFYSKLVALEKRFLVPIVLSCIAIVLAIVFMFESGMVLSFIFGGYLLLMGIVKILMVEERKSEFKKQIPVFLISFVLFTHVTDLSFRIGIIVLGAAFVILGIVNLILSNRVVKAKNKDPMVIDADMRDL